MIELQGVSKTYQTSTALQATSLLFEKGQTTVLVGPSGSGKSTLLQLINGLIASDSGQIVIAGQVLHSLSIAQLRRQMGYVIQHGGLFPHLTIDKNITLMARHIGWSLDRIQPRVRELLELVQLNHTLLNRFPRELSGGERQRVSLMRALFLDPNVLLLDEPLGALDPLTRSDLQKDLMSIFQRLGKTVILVTHDLAEAVFFADTMVIMFGGKIIQTGTPEDIVRKPFNLEVSRIVSGYSESLKAFLGLCCD